VYFNRNSGLFRCKVMIINSCVQIQDSIQEKYSEKNRFVDYWDQLPRNISPSFSFVHVLTIVSIYVQTKESLRTIALEFYHIP
jgi:hypothetical protein